MRKKEGWELMDHGSFEHSNESGVFGNILLYTIINSIMLTSETPDESMWDAKGNHVHVVWSSRE